MYVTTYSPETDCIFYRVYTIYYTYMEQMCSDKNKTTDCSTYKGNLQALCRTNIFIQNWVLIFYMHRLLVIAVLVNWRIFALCLDKNIKLSSSKYLWRCRVCHFPGNVLAGLNESASAQVFLTVHAESLTKK